MDSQTHLGAELRFGMVPTEGVHVSEALLSALSAALNELTGLEVHTRCHARYPELHDALERDELDLAWLPPLTARQAIKAQVAVVVAIPVRRGRASYHSVLFTAPAADVGGVDELAGMRGAWVQHDSIAGYLLPRAMLRAGGVDFDKAFESNTFFGSHTAVADAVLSGNADVGATFARVEHVESGVRFQDAGWGDRVVRVLEHWGPIPCDVLVASRRVARVLRHRLTSVLVDERAAPFNRVARALLNADAFKPPDDRHLEALRIYGHVLAQELEEIDLVSNWTDPPR